MGQICTAVLNRFLGGEHAAIPTFSGDEVRVIT
jgi:hypothetical protein